MDLHYSLALSYRNSPELRQTWLDSIAALHLKYGNYSEAAQCCIHIAGMVAEYLKMKGTYGAPCKLHYVYNFEVFGRSSSTCSLTSLNSHIQDVGSGGKIDRVGRSPLFSAWSPLIAHGK